MDNGFVGYHPILNFIFFIGAIIMGMIFVHPIFLCISIGASALYYLVLTGKKGIRYIFTMFIIALAISLINPILNTLGSSVLFTYLKGRRFTLEALLYGFATGGMFFSILLWFACYNHIMTSDKFIYIFGKFIPIISLLLSMVLRLIPSFKSQIMAISGARKSIGKANGKDSKRQRLFSSMDVLSALTSWALEGAIITADSMKSRGYGSGKRTHFSNYRFCIRDGIVFSIMLIGLSMVILGAIGGGMQISYYPTVSLSRGTWHMVVGALGYMMFLFIPSAIHIGEDIIWHILRSRI